MALSRRLKAAPILPSDVRRHVLRIGIVVGAVAVAVVLFLFAPALLPDAGNAERLSRREMMTGFLTLGVLVVVALGLDIRDLF